MLSVIIPTRNEPWLEWTIRGLASTSGAAPIDLHVLDDGGERPAAIPAGLPANVAARLTRLDHPVGLAHCRDLGIAAAQYDACLLLDAHVAFERAGWVEYLAAYAAANPRDCCCTVSVRFNYEHYTWQGRPQSDGSYKPHPREYGARVGLMDTDSNGWHRCLQGKWYPPDAKAAALAGKPGEVGCLMGGAYLLSRGWYLNGLRRPWAPLRGWGTSEPNLCIPNWFCGGRNMLLPLECAHIYRTGQYDIVPYRTLVWTIWSNMMRLMMVSPLPPETGTAMVEHLSRNIGAKVSQLDFNHAFFYAANAKPLPQEYQDFLLSHGRTWAEYAARWLKPPTKPGEL